MKLPSIAVLLYVFIFTDSESICQMTMFFSLSDLVPEIIEDKTA